VLAAFAVSAGFARRKRRLAEAIENHVVEVVEEVGVAVE
jgi:hypothetical protein